jgi:molybdenum cofactor cytidylyltransferase
LLDLGGRPLIQHVLDAAAASPIDEVVLVLGHAAKEIAGAVRGRIRIVVNPDYRTGHSTSLIAGLHAVDASSLAAVILLGDQPGVRPGAIESVVRAWRGGDGPVVQASYTGRPAHPTLFARSVWSELDGATGDEGARTVLAGHPDWVALVEVGGDPPDDVDTEEDYQRVKEAFGGP